MLWGLIPAQAFGQTPDRSKTAQPPGRQSATGDAAKPADATDGSLPQTQPADLGFGQNVLRKGYYFPSPKQYTARVDRRGDIDATADRTIIWPTAYTPPRHTVSYSNEMANLNRLSFSPSDTLELTTTVVVPAPAIDFLLGFATKFQLRHTANSTLSLQPFGYYRGRRRALSSRDAGLGLSFLADFAISNDFVVTLGATGYANVVYSSQGFVETSCASRHDYLAGNCHNLVTRTRVFPSGGHWLAAQVGGSYYVLDSLALKGELISGLAAGSVLGTEEIVDGEEDSKPDRFTSGAFGVGAPYDTKLTFGMGLAWSNGLFALQFSGYVYRGPSAYATPPSNADVWLLTPMLNAAVTL